MKKNIELHHYIFPERLIANTFKKIMDSDKDTLLIKPFDMKFETDSKLEDISLNIYGQSVIATQHALEIASSISLLAREFGKGVKYAFFAEDREDKDDYLTHRKLPKELEKKKKKICMGKVNPSRARLLPNNLKKIWGGGRELENILLLDNWVITPNSFIKREASIDYGESSIEYLVKRKDIDLENTFVLGFEDDEKSYRINSKLEEIEGFEGRIISMHQFDGKTKNTYNFYSRNNMYVTDIKN